jgi:hypothetical protein
MKMKVYAAALCAAAIAVTATAVPPVQAQTTTKQYAGKSSRVTSNKARSRVVVVPRSFLDAGTEVKPGERKFTDYAFPPNYPGVTGVVTNIGGRVGWDVSPFTQQPYLGGFNRW